MKQEYDFSTGARGKFFHADAKLHLPASDEKPDWVGPEGQLGEFTVQVAKGTLESYRAQSYRVTEDANTEQFAAHGGYAHRQLYELIQNSADALLGAPSGQSILIRLTEHFLYCADDGTPIDQDGVVGLMFSRMSSKLNTTAIGRFGIGFKSVLGVTDAPEFYSRPVSFRFDKQRAAERIASATQTAQVERYPVLRLPEPIDPGGEMAKDVELAELMSWATNVVRLPLKPGAHGDLARQMRDFPPEFLLFVDHVRYLTLEDGEHSRDFVLNSRDGELLLDTERGIARWRRFETTHCLSDDARGDWPLSGASGDVAIQWAAPLDRLDLPGRFWAFFPTDTASLVAGILNAPWKTNEDRQNLLPGPYNEELIEATAEMIAESLPKLATDDDPGRHLDALPRRHEGGDSKQADLLRKRLFAHLRHREVIPDQDRRLRAIGSLSYPPKRMTDRSETEAFECWSAYSGRPIDWLHHGVLTRNRVSRLAAINRLFPPRWDGDDSQSAPQASIANWLEALVEGKEGDDAIAASKAAIQTAASISSGTAISGKELGCIVLTASGDWRPPDPERVFLPEWTPADGAPGGSESFVHAALVSDHDALSGLTKLGIKSPSPETVFELLAQRVLEGGNGEELSEDLHRDFWKASRELPTNTASEVVRKARGRARRVVWPGKLRVRTHGGTWQPPYRVLLPGRILPGDGCQDEHATVDTQFHEEDEKLMRRLGVTEEPCDDRDLSFEPTFASFRNSSRAQYSKRDGLPRDPRWSYLDFTATKGPGPLEVLTVLSDDAKARYTEALLALDGSYKPWTMWHTGTNRQEYPKMRCPSLTTIMLREHGRIRTPHRIVPLSEATGSHPKSPEALRFLLGHSKAREIKEAFELMEPTPEFFGADDPIPLTDVWRGLGQYLRPHQRTCELVRCERIVVVGQLRDCIFHASTIYLADTTGAGELRKLRLVVDELDLGLSDAQIEQILRRRTP